MKDKDYVGRAAVVTGAASGIGRAIAVHALGEGMRVFAADISDEGLDSLRQEQESAPGELHTFRLDVSSTAEMEQFSAFVFETSLTVSLLFNNAGVLTTGRTWEMPVEEWQASFGVNVLGVINGLRAFVPKMLAQGAHGRILNTSSVGGLVSGGEFMGAYQGTKHMVAALTESLDRELRAQSASISVSLICPGAVATDIGKKAAVRPRQSEIDGSAETAFKDQFSRLVADGMNPKELAEEIFEGIEQNRFWIIPRSVSASRIKKRFDRITSELAV